MHSKRCNGRKAPTWIATWSVGDTGSVVTPPPALHKLLQRPALSRLGELIKTNDLRASCSVALATGALSSWPGLKTGLNTFPQFFRDQSDLAQRFSQYASFGCGRRAKMQQVCKGGCNVHDFGVRRLAPRPDPAWPHQHQRNIGVIGIG